MFRFYSIFHINLFYRTCFCSLWIVYPVSENAAFERSWIHSFSCHCIWPLLLLPLPCYSSLEHGYIVRMCVKMSSDIDCTCFLYALTVAWIWKIGSTCYPTHIFLFINGKLTNPLPKQCNKDYKMRIQRQHHAECWGQPHGSCISH